MDKLQNQSPLIKIIEAINNLIDQNKINNRVLSSIRSEKEVLEMTYLVSEIRGKIIEIPTTGMYKIIKSSTAGVAQIFINEEKGATKTRYEIVENEQELSGLTLCSGDRILISTSNMKETDTITIQLEKNLIQYILELGNSLEETRNLLSETKLLLEQHSKTEEDLQNLIELYKQGISAMNTSQTDIQKLYSEIKLLKG